VNKNSIKKDTSKRLTLELFVNHNQIYKTTVQIITYPNFAAFLVMSFLTRRKLFSFFAVFFSTLTD